MNRNEYIDSIKAKLQGLPEADINQAVEYYEEAIDDRLEDGLTEEQAMNSIGTPDEIAEKILMESPITKLISAKAKPKRSLKGWEIALLIIFSPVLIVLLAALLIVLFAIVIVILSLVVSIIIVVAGCVLGGLVGIAACLGAMIDGAGFDIVQFGYAISMLGLGTLLVVPAKNLIVWTFEQMARFFKWTKRKIINK